MKKLLTLTLAVLTLASCQKETKSNTLTVSPTTITFTASETGGKVIAVTTNALKWNAVANDAWITLSQDGAALTVGVNDAHRGTEPREGSITITAGNAEPVTVTVTQEATQSLSVSPLTLNFAAGETGSKSVTVATDAVNGWKASYSAEWFAVSSSADGKLVVTVNALHYGTTAREAAIDVTGGNAAAVTVTVSQAPTTNTLSLNPSSLEFDASETGSKTVTITTDAPGGWRATESVSWLTIATGSGSTLTVTVTEANSGESSREGTISVTAGNAPAKTITVTQSGSVLAFGDIKYGTYSASGTPSAWDNPGPRTWTGTIRPNASGQYYELTNFGGDGYTVRLKFKQGKIYVDGNYKVEQYGNYSGYLRACYEENGNIYVMNDNYDHPVDYNKATRTLTFGSLIIPSSTPIPMRIALMGITVRDNNGTNNSWEGIDTDLYANLKLTLTFNNTRAQTDEPAVGPVRRSELKPVVVKTMRNAQ